MKFKLKAAPIVRRSSGMWQPHPGENPELVQGMDPEINDIRTEAEAKRVLEAVQHLPQDHVFGLDVEWSKPEDANDKEGHLRATAISWQLSAGQEIPELKKVFFRNWGPYAGHAFRVFRPWLEDPKVLKTGHNFRSDKHVIKKHGIIVEGVVGDGNDLDWLWDEQTRENKHGLKQCVIDHLGYSEDEIHEYREWFSYLPKPRLLKSGKLGKQPTKLVLMKRLAEVVQQKAGWPWPEGGIARLANYAVKDPLLSVELFHWYKAKLSKVPWAKEWSLWDYYQRFEVPFWKTLWNCEDRGLPVNTVFLDEVSEVIDHNATKTERAYLSELSKAVGTKEALKYSISSNDQLKKLFFGELGMKPIANKITKPTKRFPNGQPQVDDDVLEALAKKYEKHAKLIQPIQEYRSLTKLNSTYVLSFIDFVNKSRDTMLHTNLRRTLSTGRLASSGPNLQNLPDPAKGTDSFGIRDSIEAPEGRMMICGDLSQIEMRLLGHFSKDEVLLNCFNSDPEIDTHCEAARALYHELKELDDETIKTEHKSKRSVGKIINFGLAYGMTEHKLARDMNISVEEAASILKRYFQRYRGIHKYIEGTKAYAHQHQHVRTYLRRYGHCFGINSPSTPFRVKKELERAMVNLTIQGSAADLITLAMVLIDNTVPNPIGEELRDLDFKLRIQVHDELLGDAPTEHAERCRVLVDEAMSNPYEYHNLAPLRCKTPADVGIGKTWFEAKH